MTGQTSLTIDELVSRSKSDYNNIRREMAIVSIPLYQIMYPNVDLNKINAGSEDANRNFVIKGVLDKIKGDHVERNAFVDKVKTTADEIKAFIEKTKLMDVPAETMTIEPMEPVYQGLTWLKFMTPAPYENGGAYKMQVQRFRFLDGRESPIVPRGIQQFLHHLLDRGTRLPGPFFPAAAIYKNASLVRKLYGTSLPLLAAWPLYTEDMFIYAGLGEYDLILRLSQLKLKLKTVIDFQMELNVHQGNYTKEQVVNYMTKGGFMTEAEAERKWEMLVLNPGYSFYPYAGLQEILDMERDYKAAKGDAFTQKEFLNKAGQLRRAARPPAPDKGSHPVRSSLLPPPVPLDGTGGFLFQGNPSDAFSPDSHCHLDMEEFASDRAAVLERARAAGVSAFLCPADVSDPKGLAATLELSAGHPDITAAAGLHPHKAGLRGPQPLALIRKLASDRKIAAIGEIGLDYPLRLRPSRRATGGLPRTDRPGRGARPSVIIHSRLAGARRPGSDRSRTVRGGGILHCFTESREIAEAVIARGFYVSFSGILTFPTPPISGTSPRALPLDRLLVETDAPYLAPVPYRGKRNEPAYVLETARVLAGLRGLLPEALAPRSP